jgi:hypothetical protein
MKKINTLNRIYIATLTALLVATVIKISNFHGSSRYYYSASVTGPPTYPIYVHSSFFIADGDDDVQIMNESVNGHGGKWGDSDMAQVTDQERLPKALVLKFVSYREKTFYTDTIPLPAKVIEDIFKTGLEKGLFKPLFRNGMEVQGMFFLVGIANNGKVVVWLQGKKFERKLLTHQLHPKVLKEVLNVFGTDYTPAEYLKTFDEYDANDYKKMLQQGIDKNANYADSSTHYLQYGLW